MNRKARRFSNTVTMTKRCLMISGRNPDTFFSSIMLPVLMMLMFVALFGKLVRVENISYVNYIVPGVILQCIGQCSSSTAIMMNRDMANGMAARFCTLPVGRAVILNGHVLEGLVRCFVTSAIVIFTAALTGFRPSAGPAGWGLVLLLILGSILAMSCLAAAVGITASSAEGASALFSLAIVLPYLSSGFVPVDSLPGIMKGFAQYQPMTPVIDAMRNALLGRPFHSGTFSAAIFWCVLLTVIFYALSVFSLYRRTQK